MTSGIPMSEVTGEEKVRFFNDCTDKQSSYVQLGAPETQIRILPAGMVRNSQNLKITGGRRREKNMSHGATEENGHIMKVD